MPGPMGQGVLGVAQGARMGGNMHHPQQARGISGSSGSYAPSGNPMNPGSTNVNATAGSYINSSAVNPPPFITTTSSGTADLAGSMTGRESGQKGANQNITTKDREKEKDKDPK